MSLRSKHKVNTAFSMSSMTDIVFLLLIFFMVTSTLIAPNALKLLLPKSTNQTLASKPITTISITNDLKYAVEGVYVSFEEIEPLLQQKIGDLSQYEEAPTISLHAEKSVAIEYVVKVMNIAKNNKYKLILATSPE